MFAVFGQGIIRSSYMPCVPNSHARSALVQTLLRNVLQALVYDSLPPTTAIIDYAIGLGKVCANGQVFANAQMAISLQQTAHSLSGDFCITAHVAYASTNTPRISLIETEHFFLLGVDMPYV